ncbi:MAG: hypothetical protein A2Y17_03930 [Clostridiales bacterium GWF2_38_85]|nr:MAG: hypothetical protein A2Y17_03930 [Clostridiales bacterium GWF2_38_85]HBL83945.1 hypothetical protein [Clostridiales bacterium]
MSNFLFRESLNSDNSAILELSKKWESENITYGYIACSIETLEKSNVWVTTEENKIVGYLHGKSAISKEICTIPNNLLYFEIDDFYILPEYRDNGLGKLFFNYVEAELKKNNIKYILLSTATKDHKRIQNFYNKKLNFNFWTTTFFKQI